MLSLTKILSNLRVEATQRRSLRHLKHPGHHAGVHRDLIEFERGDPDAIFGTYHFARNRDAGLADIVLQPGLTDFASAAIGSDNFTFEMACEYRQNNRADRLTPASRGVDGKSRHRRARYRDIRSACRAHKDRATHSQTERAE